MEAARSIRQVVGREDELSEIERFLDSLHDGFVALELQGEPGIGKTTVWREAICRAEARRYRVLVCRPAQAEAKFSFAALADLLEPVPAQTLETLPEPQRHALDVALLRVSDPGSAPEPRTAGAALRGVLAHLASATPLLLAVDDAQWLDQASAAALTFALRRLGGDRVGVLATRRRGTRRTRHALELPSAELLALDRLSLAAIHEVMKQRLGRSLPRPLLVRVYETSRGNPFFALELGREIVQSGIGPADQLPVPRDLRRLVRRRLARLSAATQEALLAAAALGEPTRELLATVTGSDPASALEEAEAAEVLDLDGALVRFAHPLYAGAVYTAASPDQRRALHGQLAGGLADVEERARHLALAAAGPSEEVAAVLEQAARHARRRGAPATAAALFAEASRLTPPEDTRMAHLRLLDAAEAHWESADTVAARRLLERLVATMPPGRDRARAHLWMAVVRSYDDGPVPAKQECLRAMDAAPDDPLLQAEASLRLSFVCIDDFEVARWATGRAVELVRSASEPPDDLVACALVDDAYIRFLTGGGLDRAQVSEAERVMPADARTWLAIRARSVRYELAKYTDDLGHARELLEQLAAERRALGDEYTAALSEHHLSEVECWLGRWRIAEEYALASGRVIEQAGNPLWRASVLTDWARIAAHLGNAVEARDAALQARVIAEEAEDPWFLGSILSVLGFIELSRDDLRAADGWLSEADATVESVGLAEPARFRFHGDHIEAVVGLGDLDRAEELLARLRRRAAVAPRPWILVMRARGEGLLAAARGRLDEAHAAFEAALGEHEQLEMPFERGRTLLCLGRLERRRKQRRAARETLERSLAIFEPLGARLWAEKARAELGRTHLREAPSELTPSEEEVVRLAATGLKNREIAERLFLSPKTVEANLARAYRKLGVRSRAELGALMAARTTAVSS